MTWRPKQWRLGAMRERIDVQTPVEVLDAAGQTIRTWTTTLPAEPAAFDPASGGETVRGKQVEASIAAVFTVHYRTTYTVTQQLLHDGLTYGIVYVKPVEGGKRYIELHCRANP